MMRGASGVARRAVYHLDGTKPGDSIEEEVRWNALFILKPYTAERERLRSCAGWS
ncbi:hypothetical protein PDENDC454_16898 [Paenibacillus dendritiformis C454]|uniref:Uncharacterized protein n=1 Tax=Paenibacillus dendritiformis C454 TaxID=1131935 RepID=H3SIK6_9BACL|nr:hypothetical protein PDENDC454_16898 [Paenibacillus dendritiformis C454]